MTAEHELKFDKWIAMRRQLRVILAAGFLASLTAFLISYSFTPKYTSQALIAVHEQTVQEGYVQAPAAEDLKWQVVAAEQKILSRNHLEPIVQRLELAKSGKELDETIESIQKNTKLEPADTDVGLSETGERSKPGQSGQVTGFYLSFTAPRPRLAQQVCGELTSMLLEENLASTPPARSTTPLFNSELEEAKRNLDDEEAKLTAFKKQHLGQLPGDASNHPKALSALKSQLAAITRSIARAQEDKAYTESLLSQQVAVWKSKQMSNNPVNTTSAQPAAENKPDANDAPELRQLRLQIQRYQEVIAQSSREQRRVQDEIRHHQDRIALSPVIEEQYRQLTRDYEAAQKFYQNLLAKTSASERAPDIDRDEAGQQITLLRAANLPEAPRFPNRPLFAAGGLVAGLTLGVGLALWVEMRDQAVCTQENVEAALEVPLLVSLPWVVSTGHNGSGKRLWERAAPKNRETAGA